MREHTIAFKVNKREKEYAESLCDKMGVNMSEAMRILLFDSRFLYSEDVDLSEINVPAEDIIGEEETETTIEEALKRVA